MQQVVHAVERVSHAELTLENLDEVASPQCAHAVGILWPGQHALTERLVLFNRQLRRWARRGLRLHRPQAVVAIGVAPALHKAARSAQHPHDRQRRFAGDRQRHRPQPVTLLGVVSLTDQLLKFVCVVAVA